MDIPLTLGSAGHVHTVLLPAVRQGAVRFFPRRVFHASTNTVFEKTSLFFYLYHRLLRRHSIDQSLCVCVCVCLFFVSVSSLVEKTVH